MGKIVYIKTKMFDENSIGGAVGHTIGLANGFFEVNENTNFITDVELNNVKSKQTILKRGKLKGNFIFDLISNRKYYRNIFKSMKGMEAKFIYHRHVLFCDIGVKLKQKYKIPLVIEYNSSEIEKWTKDTTLVKPKNIFKYFLFFCIRLILKLFFSNWEKTILNQADIIVVVSDVLKRKLINDGISKNKILVSPNGVDISFFKDNDQLGNEVKTAYGLSNKKVVIGFSGTFGNWHGIPELTKAIKRLSHMPEVGFLLIGDGLYKAQMEKELSNINQVKFTGKIPYAVMPNYLGACDILVVSNSWKNQSGDFFGSPTKLFEYMSMGKAIVGSNLEQIGKILDDDKNASLFEVGNVDELVKSLEQLIKDEYLRKKLGVNARKKAETEYTWQAVAEKVINSLDVTEEK